MSDYDAYRVFRGGSWGNDAWDARAASYSANVPSRRSLGIGLRLSRRCA